MKYPVYSVRDLKVGFDTQFLVQMNEQAAVRAFEMAIKNPGSMLAFKPSDFQLFQIGQFDTVTGVFEPCGIPVLIIGGDDFA